MFFIPHALWIINVFSWRLKEKAILCPVPWDDIVYERLSGL